MRFRIAGPYFRCAVIPEKSFPLYVNSEADEKVFDAMLLFPYMPPHIQWIGRGQQRRRYPAIREAQSNTSSAPFEMPYMIIFFISFAFSATGSLFQMDRQAPEPVLSAARLRSSNKYLTRRCRTWQKHKHPHSSGYFHSVAAAYYDDDLFGIMILNRDMIKSIEALLCNRHIFHLSNSPCFCSLDCCPYFLSLSHLESFLQT